MADLRVAIEEMREEGASGKLPARATTRKKPSRRSQLLVILFVAALLAVAAYSGFRVTSGHGGAELSLEPIPLTSYPGNEGTPSFSPDGNQVAFVWNGEHADNADIYVKMIGAATPLRLTTDPRSDILPRWSPDGKNIAFIRFTGEDTFEVLLIPPLGGAERKVGQFYTSETLSQLRRSPASTGCRMPGTSLGGWEPKAKATESNTARVAVDSGEVNTLASSTDGPELGIPPSVSPDGKHAGRDTPPRCRFH